MAKDGEQYYTDEDGDDVPAESETVCDTDIVTPIQDSADIRDDSPEPKPEVKHIAAGKKRKCNSAESDACTKIRRKLRSGTSSVANTVVRSTVPKPDAAAKPVFDGDRQRLVEYGRHLERHIEQVAELSLSANGIQAQGDLKRRSREGSGVHRCLERTYAKHSQHFSDPTPIQPKMYLTLVKYIAICLLVLLLILMLLTYTRKQ